MIYELTDLPKLGRNNLARRKSRLLQCVVDSSKELCAALAISTPKQTPADADSAPTLVVIDSVGAFYALDRAASLVPASPKMPTFGGDAALFQGTNVCAPAPPTASTLQEVHRALTGSVRALARRSVVALVTMSCATHLEDSGMVQYRPFLPKVWEVRWAARMPSRCPPMCRAVVLHLETTQAAQCTDAYAARRAPWQQTHSNDGWPVCGADSARCLTSEHV